MCWRHEQLPHVIGVEPQWATANVRQKATVICEVRGSQTDKRLMYEPRDLEHNALTDWHSQCSCLNAGVMWSSSVAFAAAVEG